MRLPRKRIVGGRNFCHTGSLPFSFAAQARNVLRKIFNSHCTHRQNALQAASTSEIAEDTRWRLGLCSRHGESPATWSRSESRTRLHTVFAHLENRRGKSEHRRVTRIHRLLRINPITAESLTFVGHIIIGVAVIWHRHRVPSSIPHRVRRRAVYVMERRFRLLFM